MTKLVVAFRNFANVPKKISSSLTENTLHVYHKDHYLMLLREIIIVYYKN